MSPNCSQMVPKEKYKCVCVCVCVCVCMRERANGVKQTIPEFKQRV